MKQIKIAIIFFLFSLLVLDVIAIGVGPAFSSINFEPNLTITKVFNIYNTDNKNFTAILNLSGDINEFIVLDKNKLFFNKSDNSQKVSFNISMPRDYPPGSYNTKIFILEDANSLEGDNIIGAVLGVSHKITLLVPQHGKYIKELFELTGKNLFFKITNIGIQNISSLSGLITFLDHEKEVLNITINKQELLSDEEFNMSNYLTLNPGIYQSITILDFDDQRKELRKTFVVGEKRIKVSNFEIHDFKAGDIGQINLFLDSNWNYLTNNLFAEIEVYNAGELVDKFETERINLNKTATLSVFWNTRNLELGIYDLNVKLYYDETITEETILINLKEEEAIVKKEKITIEMIGLIILLIIIIVLNILFTLKKKDLYSKVTKK